MDVPGRALRVCDADAPSNATVRRTITRATGDCAAASTADAGTSTRYHVFMVGATVRLNRPAPSGSGDTEVNSPAVATWASSCAPGTPGGWTMPESVTLPPATTTRGVTSNVAADGTRGVMVHDGMGAIRFPARSVTGPTVTA